MTHIDDLRTKMHAEAAALGQQAANQSAALMGQVNTKRNELAQQHCPDLLARYATAQRERQELGKEQQETAHQLRALDATPPAPGDEDAHDQRAGLLAARERRLTRQAQQLDAALAQLDQELRSRVAHAAGHEARQIKAESNRLIREMGARQQALIEQLNALGQEYNGPLGELRTRLFMLGAIVPVDTELLRDGTYRE